MKSIPAHLPASGNIEPGYGTITAVFLIAPILGYKSAGPEGLRIRVQSLAETAKNSFILNCSSMHAKTPFFFWFSHGVPADEVPFFLSLSGAPDEVPLGSINNVVDGGRQMDVLDNVIRDTS